MTSDGTVMFGEVIGAEFCPADTDDGRIVVRVAVDAECRIGHRRVVVLDDEYFDEFSAAAAESIRQATRNVTAGSSGSGFSIRTPDGWFVVTIEASPSDDAARRWTGPHWFGGR